MDALDQEMLGPLVRHRAEQIAAARGLAAGLAELMPPGGQAAAWAGFALDCGQPPGRVAERLDVEARRLLASDTVRVPRWIALLRAADAALACAAAREGRRPADPPADSLVRLAGDFAPRSGPRDFAPWLGSLSGAVRLHRELASQVEARLAAAGGDVHGAGCLIGLALQAIDQHDRLAGAAARARARAEVAFAAAVAEAVESHGGPDALRRDLVAVLTEPLARELVDDLADATASLEALRGMEDSRLHAAAVERVEARQRALDDARQAGREAAEAKAADLVARLTSGDVKAWAETIGLTRAHPAAFEPDLADSLESAARAAIEAAVSGEDSAESRALAESYLAPPPEPEPPTAAQEPQEPRHDADGPEEIPAGAAAEAFLDALAAAEPSA